MVKLPSFTVVGMSDFIPDDEPEMYAELWGKIMAKMGPLMGKVDMNTGYGLTLDYDEDEGIFHYLAGFKAYDPMDVPEGFATYDLPAQKYAIFTTTMAGIHDTYMFIYEEWLPKAGYNRAGGPDFELYDTSFNPEDPASQLYVYIPID
jgi:predicted transcriptional regulator YdeE